MPVLKKFSVLDRMLGLAYPIIMNKMSPKLKKKIESLLVAYGKGDWSAFEEVYRLAYNFQFLQACQFLGDACMAEDVVQETFLRLYKNPGKIANIRYPYAYLKQITYNLCIDKISAPVNTNECRADEELLCFIEDERPDASPESHAILTAASDELNAALQTLPPDERTIFILRFVDELKINEIVLATGLSKSTVKRKIQTAREHMKNILHPRWMPGFLLTGTLASLVQNGFTDFAMDTARADRILYALMEHGSELAGQGSAAGISAHAVSSISANSRLSAFFSSLSSSTLVTATCTVVVTGAVLIAPSASHQSIVTADDTAEAHEPEPYTLAEESPEAASAPADTQIPELVSYECIDGTIVLTLKDDLSGVDYAAITASSDNGPVPPVNISEAENQVTFEISNAPLTVNICDKAGNSGSMVIEPDPAPERP